MADLSTACISIIPAFCYFVIRDKPDICIAQEGFSAFLITAKKERCPTLKLQDIKTVFYKKPSFIY
jgi:hypothetical protein